MKKFIGVSRWDRVIMAVACIDKYEAIGKNGELLIHLKEDMQLFKDITMDHAIIMGRKTFESLPNKKVLNGRLNIILTRDKEYTVKNGIVFNSIEEMMETLPSTLDLIVIGGGKIYAQMLRYCNYLVLTKVDKDYDGDTHFPYLEDFVCIDDYSFTDTKIDAKVGLYWRRKLKNNPRDEHIFNSKRLTLI